MELGAHKVPLHVVHRRRRQRDPRGLLEAGVPLRVLPLARLPGPPEVGEALDGHAVHAHVGPGGVPHGGVGGPIGAAEPEHVVARVLQHGPGRGRDGRDGVGPPPERDVVALIGVPQGGADGGVREEGPVHGLSHVRGLGAEGLRLRPGVVRGHVLEHVDGAQGPLA